MDTTKSMQAKAPERRSREHRAARTRGSAARLLRDARDLLRAGQVHDARQLAAKALARHPDDPDLRNVDQLLNGGRSSKKPATGHGTREELEWLRDPPEAYRGKWVALIGRKVVGVADSLKELAAGMPSDLERTPLAVQIAS